MEKRFSAVSDSSGAFSVASLDPGVYSALIIGASGIGLVGFELVPELNASAAAVGGEVSLVQVLDAGVAAQFVMVVTPGGSVMSTFQDMGGFQDMSGDGVVVEEQVIVEEIVDTGFGVPMGGGGFAGGGFGGGGGGLLGGGGGGLGGLLGIGGLAAAIVALATDDDAGIIATPGSL